MPYDFRGFVASVAARTLAHELPSEPGAFSRWAWQDDKQSRQLGASIYGCADAIHVLYTLDALPTDTAWRARAVAKLQGLQSADDGLYREGPLHFLHTTAFAAGALELLDAQPARKAAGLAPYVTGGGVRALMDSLDWTAKPWVESHKGAGVYASVLLAGEPAADWEDAYFEWLWENQDPETGLWRKGCVRDASGKPLGAPFFHHLASSFHYLFNHDYARRPLRHTEALIDTCLQLSAKNELPKMGQGLSWNEIDWLYTLRSLQKRSPHRSKEISVEIRRVADLLLPSVMRLDPATEESINDLHTLFAGLSALAVLQEALPGVLRTAKPLRLVLERKPFL